MKISRLPNGSPEIFHTLQGEGPTLGSPAVFLRLSLCNLHCHWCDTPYTWNWEKTPWPHQDGTKFSKAEQIIDLSPAQIAPLINNFHCKRLVITGGEPLLQQNDLLPLLQLLPNTPFLEIETNGTQLSSPYSSGPCGLQGRFLYMIFISEPYSSQLRLFQGPLHPVARTQ